MDQAPHQPGSSIPSQPNSSWPLVLRLVVGPVIFGVVNALIGGIATWAVHLWITPFEELGILLLIIGPVYQGGAAAVIGLLILPWFRTKRTYQLAFTGLFILSLVYHGWYVWEQYATKALHQRLVTATSISTCNGHIEERAWQTCVDVSIITLDDLATCRSQVDQAKIDRRLSDNAAEQYRIHCQEAYEQARLASAGSYADCLTLEMHFAECAGKFVITETDYQNCRQRLGNSDDAICHQAYAIATQDAHWCGEIEGDQQPCLNAILGIDLPDAEIVAFCDTFAPFNLEIKCLAYAAVQGSHQAIAKQLCQSIPPSSTDPEFRSSCPIEALSGAALPATITALTHCFTLPPIPPTRFEFEACVYRYVRTEDALKQCLTLAAKAKTYAEASQYMGGCRSIANRYFGVKTTYVVIPEASAP